MNVTTHLKLQQPTSDEKYNVANQNANMDILDSEVKKLQEADKNLLSKSAFNEHSSNQNNPHSVTKTQLGLGNVNNVRQLPVITDAVTPNGVPVFDGNGYKLKDSGFLLEASVPSNAKFTDTVYVHPKSDILEGTYNSVFVNNDGHVLRGENPTTLSGYGITDGETKGSAATALINAKKYTDVQVASVQSGSGLKKMIVATLPTANIDQNTLYLIPSGNDTSENKYKEYLNLDGTSNGWEYVGNSNVDLADYYNKSEANRLFLLKNSVAQSNVNDSGKVPSSAALFEYTNNLQAKITAIELMEKTLDDKISLINQKIEYFSLNTMLYKPLLTSSTINKVGELVPYIGNTNSGKELGLMDGWYAIIFLPHASPDGYGAQIALPYTPPDIPKWRHCYNGKWALWSAI